MSLFYLYRNGHYLTSANGWTPNRDEAASFASPGEAVSHNTHHGSQATSLLMVFNENPFYDVKLSLTKMLPIPPSSAAPIPCCSP